MVNGYIYFHKGQMLAGLTLMLEVFSNIIAVEVVIAAYAHLRINMFAEERFNASR